MAILDRFFGQKALPQIERLSQIPLERKSLGVAPGGDQPYYYSSGYPSGLGTWPMLLPSTRLNYRAEAGDLTQNAIVMATVHWIARTFPEAPVRVLTQDADGDDEPVDNHPLTKLLNQPNPYYNGLLLWQATLISWNLAGDAYWLKVQSNGGQLRELWYEPHMTCRPVWPSDGSEFISGYQVLRSGQWRDVPKESVVHFRNGIDPQNPRQGLSPLASALREVFTDNESANYSATLLRNMGVPGVIVSPADAKTTIDDPEGLKQALVAKLSGDRRGEPLVMQGPTKMEVLSWSPQQMNMDALRTIPEERISALLGVPAVVIGLGAGLAHMTFHNYGEAKASAYENNLIPTQRLLAAQLDADVLPDVGNPETEHVEFDISNVAALSDDQNEMMTRMVEGFKGGILKRSEARTLLALNLDQSDEDEIYITDIITKRATLTEAENPGTLLGIEEPAALGTDTGPPPKIPPPSMAPALPPPMGKGRKQKDSTPDEDEAARLMQAALDAKFGSVLASKKSGSNGH